MQAKEFHWGMASKYLILIVEDDQAVRLTLQELLILQNYKVETASNGLEGFNKAKRIKPDLIISDIMMPKQDGYELLNQLRQHPELELTPVIFLTAKAMLESRLKGLEYGADGYVTKPFHPKELTLRVNHLIQQRKKILQAALQQPEKVLVESQEERFLKQLRQSIEQHMGNPNLSIGDLAFELAVSISTLQKRLKKINGMAVSQYLREYRLKRARDLIHLGYGNLSEIARKTGFRSLSYFSTSFKEFFGQRPSDLV